MRPEEMRKYQTTMDQSKIHPMIRDTLHRFEELSKADQRTYFRALEYSVFGDGGQPPTVISPSEIEEKTKITIAVLYDANILVCRERAINFFSHYRPNFSTTSYKKRMKSSSYIERFGKPPIKLGNKHIFTYLEVMELEKNIYVLEMPANYKELTMYLEGE